MEYRFGWWRKLDGGGGEGDEDENTSFAVGDVIELVARWRGRGG